MGSNPTLSATNQKGRLNVGLFGFRQWSSGRGRQALTCSCVGGTFVGYALHQNDSPFRHYLGISPGIGATVFLSVGSQEMTNMFNQQAGIPAQARQ